MLLKTHDSLNHILKLKLYEINIKYLHFIRNTASLLGAIYDTFQYMLSNNLVSYCCCTKEIFIEYEMLSQHSKIYDIDVFKTSFKSIHFFFVF